MRPPRTFRQAFAESAGAELGRAAGALPIMILFGAVAFAPYVISDWYDRREARDRAPKDSAKTYSRQPA